MERTGYYVFVLLLTLVLVVYYQGAKSNIQTLGAAANNFIYAITGRNRQGVFQRLR